MHKGGPGTLTSRRQLACQVLGGGGGGSGEAGLGGGSKRRQNDHFKLKITSIIETTGHGTNECDFF